jgi:hypothetical protein
MFIFMCYYVILLLKKVFFYKKNKILIFMFCLFCFVTYKSSLSTPLSSLLFKCISQTKDFIIGSLSYFQVLYNVYHVRFSFVSYDMT